MLEACPETERAQQYGPDLKIGLLTKRAGTRANSVGIVRIRFSELPVDRWHALDLASKRRLGIMRRGGVSILRGNREIDFGWFFMGKKRKENYDDWWRYEIDFAPVLDDLFGITYTKQPKDQG